MGERGHTVHVLGGRLGEVLANVGHRLAVLGSNERWTTFVPTNASTFDAADASKVLARTLLHVWFDDDAGVSVQAYRSGDFVGELSLPSDDAEVSESDLAFTETLEELGILSRVQRAVLLKRMSEPAGLRAWTMTHGLEELLELPLYEPMPSDLPERELLALLPKAANVLEGKTVSRARTRKTPGANEPTPPPKASWSDEEKATVDLHCEYWSTVFSMNNWKLYGRYKKHLPADQRRDVDALCNAVATGDDDAVCGLVKGILARIWRCEDWDAVIRDPALVDGEEDVWEEWLARVSS